MSRGAAVILGAIIITALISGIIWYKFTWIMGACALSIAFWGIWSMLVLSFLVGDKK